MWGIVGIKILTCVCVCVCMRACVTEVGCSWGGTRLVTRDLCTSIIDNASIY